MPYDFNIIPVVNNVVDIYSDIFDKSFGLRVDRSRRIAFSIHKKKKHENVENLIIII